MSHFSREKAIEVILFIAKRLDRPQFHQISKMLYFADKLHLERYGRLVCGDSYIAMEYGPVPSGVYDIMKHNGIVYLDAFTVDGYQVLPSRPSDIDELSDSDTECLEEAIKLYGGHSFGELVDITHADSAWQQAPQNREMTLESIVAMLDNSDELLEFLDDPNP
mgnify:CR=1 FL=1